jgi:hypothetical protein
LVGVALTLHGCGLPNDAEEETDLRTPTTATTTVLETFPDCDGLETVVGRNTSVKLPEHWVRDFMPDQPDLFGGNYRLNGFKVQQGGDVIVSVSLGMNNLFSTLLNVSNPASWCDEQGDHDFSVKIRGICKLTSGSYASDTDHDYFLAQGEMQIATECFKLEFGSCRILKVGKPGTPGNGTWIESQSSPATGGSMVEAANGSSLILKWDTCPNEITNVVVNSRAL